MKGVMVAAALALTFCSVNTHAQTQSNPPSTPTATQAAKPSPTPPAWLDRRVRDEAAKFEGTVSLYAKNLDTGAEYSFGGDERVRTASTIKVAIMIEAFSRVAEGRAKWTDELVLTKEKKVSGSGMSSQVTASAMRPRAW